MEDLIFSLGGTGLFIILALLVILIILWITLPFAIFGIKPLLKGILIELKKMNGEELKYDKNVGIFREVINEKLSINNEFDKQKDQEKCPTCNIVHEVGKYIGLKLCPNCNAYQDGRHIKCPECSYDISNIEITKK